MLFRSSDISHFSLAVYSYWCIGVAGYNIKRLKNEANSSCVCIGSDLRCLISPILCTLDKLNFNDKLNQNSWLKFCHLYLALLTSVALVQLINAFCQI